MSHSHSIKEYPGQMAGLAIIAAAAGAIGGILMAPKRGADTRLQVRMKATQMKEKMKSSKQAATDVAEDAANKASDTMQSATSRAKGTASKIKQDAKETTSEIKSDAKDTAKESKDVTEHIRRNGEP